jgi:hypothetical protein
MNRYEELYGVRLLDDLHNYFPSILYQPQRFQTVQDLLQYISNQTQGQFNLFDRGMQRFEQSQTTPRNTPASTTHTRSPTQGHAHIITETFDLSPLFNIPFSERSVPATGAQGSSGLSSLQSLINLLRPPSMDPVVVAPTAEQIRSATTVRQATEDQDGEAICSICQEGYTDDEDIRQINHCRHCFHKACIDPWFRQHVHCPVCRFDIRES